MLAIVDLPAPDSPVNQTIAGFCFFSAARSLLPIEKRLPVNVGRAAQAERDHAGADRAVRVAVDDDEGAGLPVLLVGIEDDRRRRRDVAEADVVEAERRGGEMLARVDVDLVLDRGDAGRRDLGADPHQVGAARNQRLLVHPDQMGGELIGHLGPLRSAATRTSPRAMSISSASVIVTASPACSVRQCAVIGDDAVDARRSTGRHDDDRIAAPRSAGRHRSGIAAEIKVGPVDPLHRKAERLGLHAVIGLDILEIVQQGRAAIPRRIGGRLDDVVAEARGDRDRNDRGEAELGGEGDIVADNAIEDLLGVADKIDLVHGEDDVTNAEQRADEGVSLGLHQDALAGIDQDDGELRVGGAGRHVAGILLVAGRVGDHERAVAAC